MSFFINFAITLINLIKTAFVNTYHFKQRSNNITVMLQSDKMKNDCNVLLFTRNLQKEVSLVECGC